MGLHPVSILHGERLSLSLIENRLCKVHVSGSTDGVFF